nr:DUF371 domain-containing protein [Candidatus Sigynarchaeota archaeon]
MPGQRTLLESFTARGHPNVRSSHETTLEFTKASQLTTRGDCIAGVEASLAPADFKESTRAALQSSGAFLLEIRVGNFIEQVHGHGHPGLSLNDAYEMVFRKSQYLSGRTVLVSCDKAAMDFDPKMKKVMQRPGQLIDVALYKLD